MTRFNCGMASFGPRRLVVGEREIQADGVVQGVALQRRLVLLDRFVVLAEADVRRAQVGECVGACRRDRQNCLVGVDRPEDVARLVQFDAARA